MYIAVSSSRSAFSTALFLGRIKTAEAKYALTSNKELYFLLMDLNVFFEKENKFRNKLMKVYRLAKEEVRQSEKAKTEYKKAEKHASKAQRAGDKLLKLLK